MRGNGDNYFGRDLDKNLGYTHFKILCVHIANLYVNIGPMTHAWHFFVEYLFIIENNV